MITEIMKFLNKMFLQNTIQQWLIAVAVVLQCVHSYEAS